MYENITFWKRTEGIFEVVINLKKTFFFSGSKAEKAERELPLLTQKFPRKKKAQGLRIHPKS